MCSIMQDTVPTTSVKEKHSRLTISDNLKKQGLIMHSTNIIFTILYTIIEVISQE